MTDAGHGNHQRLLFGLSCLGTVVPLNAFAADAANGYLYYLGTDAVIITILASNAFLLLGFLFRLRQVCKTLAIKNSALEKSEKRLPNMGDHLPNNTLFQLKHSASNGFSFCYLSKNCKDLLGIERDRLMQDAKLAFDHLYEEDISALQEAYRLAVKSLHPADLGIRMLDISGHLKWLHISAVPHRENDVLVWDGIAQDISDSKNTENALVEEKRNFQHLFETIDDFLLVCDMNGNLIHTNPSVETRLGYSQKDLGEMNLVELYPERLRSEVRQIVALMQSEKTTTCGLPLHTKSGDTIPVEMNIFQGSWKNAKAIFGVARDTTFRRQTETALHESQKMLQLIMNTIPMSVFWKDRDSAYLGCNQAFVNECGCNSADEIIGKTPYDLFDPDTATSLVAHDQRVLGTNQPIYSIPLSFSRPDGSIGQRETSIIPLQNEIGQVVGVLGVWRDVTEQNSAEERLKRTLEDMERFNHLMRGRERRTLELKSEVNQLLEELGRPVKYQTTAENLP